jgi:hypothetical protein
MAITPAVLHNGLGRYQDALAAADQASAHLPERGRGLAQRRESARQRRGRAD